MGGSRCERFHKSSRESSNSGYGLEDGIFVEQYGALVFRRDEPGGGKAFAWENIMIRVVMRVYYLDRGGGGGDLGILSNLEIKRCFE